MILNLCTPRTKASLKRSCVTTVHSFSDYIWGVSWPCEDSGFGHEYISFNYQNYCCISVLKLGS